MLRLRVTRPGQLPRVVELAGDAAVLGRAQDCDVVIDDPEVSRRHARILSGVVVADLGSRNGTWVGELKASEPTIVPGGQFLLGKGEGAIAIDVESDARAAAIEVPSEDPEATITVAQASKPKVEPAVPLAAPVPASAREPQNGMHSSHAANPSSATGASAVELNRVRTELEEERLKVAHLTRDLEASRGDLAAGKVSAKSGLAEAQLEVLRLNQRVSSLRAELDAKGSAAVSQAPPPSSPQGMGEFVTRMQRELTRLQQENKALKESPAQRPLTPSHEAPRASPAAPFAPPPARAQPAAAPAPVTNTALLRSFLGSDPDAIVVPAGASVDSFLLAAAVRFLRSVEKVVTRTVGEFIEVLDMGTILPDSKANFRGRLKELLDLPDNAECRRALESYLNELRRWLFAAFGAYKTAAKEFGTGLKSQLSEQALTESAPISAFKSRETELWRRASQLLKELTPETIDDRVEKLARIAAQQLLARGGAAS